DVLYYRDIRHGHVPPQGDATVSPLQDTNFARLPPTVTFGAECDPLCDDARTYAVAITNAGGRAHAFLEAGLVHGYLRARHTVPRAANSFARITTALTALARREWPYGDAK
ncbi:MAG: alpha/beta hydrolase, partial [Paracoccaceae bacterium]